MYIIRYGAVFYGPAVRRRLPINIMTLPEMAEYFYNQKAHIASTFLSIIFNISRFGVQFLAIGLLLNFLFGLNLWLGAIIAAGITLFYTAMSGLYGVALTDVVQMVFMLIGIGVATISGLFSLGGWERVVSQLPQHYTLWHGNQPYMALVAFAIMAFYMYPDPVFYQRYSAGRSPKQVKFAMASFILLAASFGIIACVNAIMARVIFPTENMPAFAIYSFMAKFMPPGIFGMFLAGFIAAGMSTADGYLLLASSNISRDIYKRWFNKEASDQTVIKITRIAMILLAIISTYIVIQFKTVWDLWAWGAMMFAAAAFIPFVPGIFWRWRKHKDAAWISIVVAILLYIFLYPPKAWAPDYVPKIAIFFGVSPFSGAHKAYIFLLTWMTSAIVYILINLLFGKSCEKIEKEEEWRQKRAEKIFYDRATLYISIVFWVVVVAAIYSAIRGGVLANLLWLSLGILSIASGIWILICVLRSWKELRTSV
jgi:Na+/proline symporter